MKGTPRTRYRGTSYTVRRFNRRIKRKVRPLRVWGVVAGSRGTVRILNKLYASRRILAGQSGRTQVVKFIERDQLDPVVPGKPADRRIIQAEWI
jgi:hypothetical protein